MDNYDITFNIYNPNGTLKWTATYTQNGYQDVGYYYMTQTLPINASSGTWKFNAVYNGVTYSHFFTVNCTFAYTLSGAESGHQGFLASDHITSTATIACSSSNQVTYEAENYIQLNVGFTATENSWLLARIDGCDAGGLKTQEESTESIPSENKMETFPNPFLSATDIQLTLTRDAPVSISLLDITGKEVSRLVDQQFYHSGIYDVEFSGEHLQAGIYFIKAEIKGEQLIQKIIKLE